MRALYSHEVKRVLTSTFYARTADVVAPDLLGTFLVRQEGSVRKALMITETEAYDGFEDKASHAARGRTARTETMYGNPGRWYVYLIYGMHNMLNIVTGQKDYPSAVLIRGVADIDGPGKLTRSLSIHREFNGKTASKKNDLWIEDRGVAMRAADILRTPRIGVDYAGEWARRPLRFVIKKGGVL